MVFKTLCCILNNATYKSYVTILRIIGGIRLFSAIGWVVVSWSYTSFAFSILLLQVYRKGTMVHVYSFLCFALSTLSHIYQVPFMDHYNRAINLDLWNADAIYGRVKLILSYLYPLISTCVINGEKRS